MTLGQLIPKYARKPLLITLGINCVVYYGPKLLMPVLHYHKLQTALDPLIPQVPVFIYIYVLAFLQWGLGYIIIARDSRERCYRVLSGEIIVKLIALTIFLLWPTVMDRPAPAPGWFRSFLLCGRLRILTISASRRNRICASRIQN